ncbi:hypothetical protein FQA39_LY11618 [Lamprigera yunnana]|nr:hypothetical protein FQA39_LY11618 [Lamprigera yunnana]
MLSENIEWIGALCGALTLICVIQLIFAALFLWNIPELLILTKSHVSTLAGLIAGFITLPAVIRFKTARMSPKMDRIYGYTLCYQRLTVSVAGTLHFSATILAVVALATMTGDIGEDFKKLMKTYGSNTSSKILVDNVQFLMQCCGKHSYKDWYSIFYFDSDKKKDLLKLDNEIQSKRVPFSCCSRTALTPCNFENLEFGKQGVNKEGCEVKLKYFARTLLWFEFVFYGLSFSLEATILVLFSEAAKEARKSESERNSTKLTKWVSFVNSSSSILWHTSSSGKKVDR